MPKHAFAFRFAFFLTAPFAAAGALAAGCGLDDSVISAGVAGSDGGGTDATFDSSPGDSSTSACATNPCENGGTCADNGSGGFTCTCAKGYTGTTCATQIDECITADGGPTCLNDGGCTGGVGTFTCSCAHGWSGDNCETQVDNCAANPCAHGTCMNNVGSYTCTCTTGFAGDNCDTCATDYYGYPTCAFCQAATTCSTHGTCSATGSCNCATGFTGGACNSCATNYYGYPNCTFCTRANTCSNHGDCSTTGTCNCDANYSGASCGTFSGSYAGNATMPSTGTNSDKADQYGQVNGTAAFSTTNTDNQLTVATATTLTKLTFGPQTGDIGSRNWTATIMKNTVATALTCTIASGGTTCNFSSNVSLAVGDKINIQVQQDQATGTSRVAMWTINYTQP